MGDKELVKKAYPELLKDLEKDLEELKLQEMDYYKIVARKELYKRHGRKSGTYGYSNEVDRLVKEMDSIKIDNIQNQISDLEYLIETLKEMM